MSFSPSQHRADEVPGIEGVDSWDDVSAVFTHKHLDSVIKGRDFLDFWLALLNDLEWVTWSTAQRIGHTRALRAAVRIHAVNKTIWVEKMSPHVIKTLDL